MDMKDKVFTLKYDKNIEVSHAYISLHFVRIN